MFYVSTDGGFNWKERSAIPNVTGNGAILGMTSDGANLYAISNRKSIYTSTNNGGTWDEKIIEHPNASLLVDFSAIGDLYVAAFPNIGTLISTNAGATWGLKNPSSAILALCGYQNVIYGMSYVGGIYKISNGDTSWTAINNGIPDGGSFQIPKAMCAVNGTL